MRHRSNRLAPGIACLTACLCACCRPANILLDEQLNAFLGDTGFAKAAQKSGDRSGATTSVWGGAGSLGYCENALRPPDEQTEAFAVGMTLLVVLTGRDPIDIEEVCCEACVDIDEDIRFEDIPVERLAQAGAGWPAEVAGKVKQLYLQLTNKKRAKRLALATLLQSLRALLEAGGSVQKPTADSVGKLAPATLQTTAATPLSQQVRGMRTGGDAQKRIQDNMLLAFSNVVPRLDAVYTASAAVAPESFQDRINFWHRECSMPTELKDRLHVLRVWANAARHHDAARWRCEGPRSEAEASQLVAAVQTAIEALES